MSVRALVNGLVAAAVLWALLFVGVSRAVAATTDDACSLTVNSMTVGPGFEASIACTGMHEAYGGSAINYLRNGGGGLSFGDPATSGGSWAAAAGVSLTWDLDTGSGSADDGTLGATMTVDSDPYFGCPDAPSGHTCSVDEWVDATNALIYGSGAGATDNVLIADLSVSCPAPCELDGGGGGGDPDPPGGGLVDDPPEFETECPDPPADSGAGEITDDAIETREQRQESIAICEVFVERVDYLAAQEHRQTDTGMDTRTVASYGLGAFLASMFGVAFWRTFGRGEAG